MLNFFSIILFWLPVATIATDFIFFNRGVYMSTKAAFNEDKVALVCGLFIFVLALGKLIGLDILGWTLKVGM